MPISVLPDQIRTSCCGVKSFPVITATLSFLFVSIELELTVPLEAEAVCVVFDRFMELVVLFVLATPVELFVSAVLLVVVEEEFESVP